MLYYLAEFLIQYFGPARLFTSHAVLLAGGTLTAALLTAAFLPRLARKLPRDRGKALCKDLDGMLSQGKPTGAGLPVTLLILPALILFAPLAFWDAMCIVGIYASMVTGYLDDRAATPWGEGRKLALDIIVSLAIAVFIFLGHAEPTLGGSRAMIAWLPFVKSLWNIPFWIYVPTAAFVILFTLNATNCSDGVDGLAGSLTVITLVILAVILYIVVGYRPVAHYFLIPVYAEAARWAIVVMIVAGGFGGYLWYNAEPSKLLMGDAGSRFLGVLVATAALMTGNPLLILALSPVVLVNGGGGLLKLLLLRGAKKIGMQIDNDSVLKRIRFPLHDHCKKNLGWSNAQVLMRFILLQLLIMPLLLILLIKVR